MQLLSRYLPLLGIWVLGILATDGDKDQNNDGNDQKGNFTIVNGQIFTPGLAVLDAPQPFTPEGGDFLQVALDITGSGRLPWPKVDSDSPTLIHNITLFLTSYVTGWNFTISNGTINSTSADSGLGTPGGSTKDNNTAISPPITDILLQEPSSTVKHVNWLWPSCLVGNGAPKPGENGLGGSANTSARGAYNISIHQSYRLNGSDYYTIFDLPISVTNEIPDVPSSKAWGNDPDPGPASANRSRIDCELLRNPLLNWTFVNSSVNAPATQPYLGGPVVASGSNVVNGSGSNGGNGIDSSLAAPTTKAWGAGMLSIMAVMVGIVMA